MTVGFFHVDREPGGLHRALAQLLVTSVRRAMPNVPIAHFTDTATVGIAGVDDVLRRPDGPIALSCLRAYAAVSGDWLFVDTDVLILEDVQSVFRERFDVAVASRSGTLLEKEVGTKFMAAMPFNKGAVFSRSAEFWAAAAGRLEAMSSKRQAWMGDQLAMNEEIRHQAVPVGRWTVCVLVARYNYPPHTRDEDLCGHAIVHFKGPRKEWMPHHAKAISR